VIYALERTLRQLLSALLFLPVWLVLQVIFSVLVVLGRFLLENIEAVVDSK